MVVEDSASEGCPLKERENEVTDDEEEKRRGGEKLSSREREGETETERERARLNYEITKSV